MSPVEARKDPRFQKWEYEVGEAQKKLDEAMRKILHHFPLTDGGYWMLMDNGKLSVCYHDLEDNYD